MNDKHGDEDSDGENVQTSHRKIVEIVVSPGLFKRGNTDGERFDIESCVEPSEVKCKRPSIGVGHAGLTKGQDRAVSHNYSECGHTVQFVSSQDT